MPRAVPTNRSQWPEGGPWRDLVEHLDRIREDNGRKSLRAVAAAMNLRSQTRVNDLLRALGRPADETQARDLARALGGGDDEIEKAGELYRRLPVADSARPVRERRRTRKLEDRDGTTAAAATYLDTVVTWAATAPGYFRRPVDVSRVGQPVLVTASRMVATDRRTSRGEALRVGTFALDETHHEQQLGLAYGRRTREDLLSRLGTADVVPWNDVRASADRVVVLGDPGFGKTWLLRNEVRLRAEPALVALHEGTDPAEIHVPVFIRLSAFADMLDRGQAPVDAVVAIATRHARSRTTPEQRADLRRWLHDQIQAGRATLCFDALDEVAGAGSDDTRTTSRRSLVVDAVAELAGAIPAGMLVTSRITGYDAQPVSLGPIAVDAEIVAFDPESIDRFVRAWFEDETEHATELIDHIRAAPALETLARVPLLLSFLCLVAGTGAPIPRHRHQLFENVLTKLIERPWRDAEPLGYAERIARLDLLEDVATHFAGKVSGWEDVLALEETLDVIERSCTRRVSWTTPPPRASVPLRHAERELATLDEVIVAAGDAHGRGGAPLTFLHRTLQEYLTAAAMARTSPSRLVTALHPKLWYDADWREVIPLAAGLAADPAPVIADITSEPDALREMTLLAGLVLAEVTRELPEPHELSGLGAMLRSPAATDRVRASRVLVRLGGPTVAELLGDVLDDDSAAVRLAAADALTRIGHAAPLRALAPVLLSDDPLERTAAHNLLGRRGRDLVVSVLHAEMFTVGDDQRATTAEALAALGDPVGVATLIGMLAGPADGEVQSAAGALARLQLAETIPAMVDALPNASGYVRSILAEGLAGHPDQARGALDRLLADEDPWARVHAAGGLARTGDVRAFDVLEASLANPYVREQTFAALSLAGPVALPVLERQLERMTGPSRVRAVQALGDLGSAAGPLLRRELDAAGDDEHAQFAAAVQLLRNGDPLGERPVAALLTSVDPFLRFEAAAALATWPVTTRPASATAITEAVLESWADVDLSDFRIRCYDVLVRIAATLRAECRTFREWQSWRDRLLPPTQWIEAQSPPTSMSAGTRSGD